MTLPSLSAEGATPFLRASAPPREKNNGFAQRREDAEKHCSFLQPTIHALFASMRALVPPADRLFARRPPLAAIQIRRIDTFVTFTPLATVR